MNPPVYVVGAGGHAKVVISALVENHIHPVAIYDDDSERWGTDLYGIPIKGGLDDFVTLGSVQAVIAIGNNVTRKQIAERCDNVDWLTVIHPYTCIHPSVKIGQGTVILEGVVIQLDVTIGQHCILNVDCMLGHDCVLDDYVHACGAKLAGNVHLCEGVFLGGNSTAHPGITIGAWSKSAVGATILRTVEPHSILIGNPARRIPAEP